MSITTSHKSSNENIESASSSSSTNPVNPPQPPSPNTPQRKKNILNIPQQFTKGIVTSTRNIAKTTQKVGEELVKLPSNTQKAVVTAAKSANTAARETQMAVSTAARGATTVARGAANGVAKGATTVAKGASTAAKGIVHMPQHIGKTVLSVPQTISTRVRKTKRSGSNVSNASSQEDEMDDITAKLRALNQEIVDEQGRKKLVRESLSQCMKEIQTHLDAFLIVHPLASYEEWIALLHPENVHGEEEEVDHRFFVEESDHLRLWNQYMSDLEFTDRIVEAKFKS